eukprot:scaffold76529_cov55-Attheya_sp.AAC.1
MLIWELPTSDNNPRCGGAPYRSVEPVVPVGIGVAGSIFLRRMQKSAGNLMSLLRASYRVLA